MFELADLLLGIMAMSLVVFVMVLVAEWATRPRGW
jgi:hypothetical protein